MNTQIEAIEAANTILMQARIAAMEANNSVGHSILCDAMRHLNAQLKEMIAE